MFALGFVLAVASTGGVSGTSSGSRRYLYFHDTLLVVANFHMTWVSLHHSACSAELFTGSQGSGRMPE